jgi:hypothetical protein
MYTPDTSAKLPYPLRLAHNNPTLPIVNSEDVAGGRIKVANLVELLDLRAYEAKLVENLTEVYVESTGQLYVLKSKADMEVLATGWSAGGLGTGDKSYTHNQSSANTVWTITHNMNKMPNVVVQDTAGTTVEGGITYINTNQLTITFSMAISGKAYLN